MAQPMRTPRPEARPSESPRPARMAPEQEPTSRQVAPVLWGLLILSLVFLAGVQVYVTRVARAPIPELQSFAALPLMESQAPLFEVPAASLELRWGTVSGAMSYHLHILTDRNNPVLDPVEVWSTNWQPSQEVLPGLLPGGYRWSVEALDSAGTVLARSAPGTFEIY